jgi:hypothetical protein
MKKLILIISFSVAVASCSQATRYVEFAEHPYRTDPNCQRTEPIGKFDQKCDDPHVGFKGFSPPPTVGSGF